MSSSDFSAGQARARLSFGVAPVVFGIGFAAALLFPASARADDARAPPVEAAPAAARALDSASWRPGDPIPPGTRAVLRPSRWIVSSGATLFALSYLSSAAGAASGYDTDASATSSRGALWIPALGPFIALGDSTATGSVAAGFLYVLDGLAQIGGLAMFVYGFAAPMPSLVPLTAARSNSEVKITVVPFRIGDASGASLVATF